LAIILINIRIDRIKKEKLKSELKRIRSWNINPNNIVNDVIKICKDKDGGYVPILIKQGK